MPYACPFCAEEDLRPVEGGRWHCRSCLRLFSVRFHGLAAPATTTPAPAVPTAAPTRPGGQPR